MATEVKPSAGSSQPQGSGGSKPSKRLAFEPASQHTSDEFLQDFLDPSFDPISYINASLPALAQKPPAPTPNADAVPLVELAGRAQTLISQLDAHTTRLSDTLTRITDDILRSGGRMSYEVEMLRGEALTLEELLFEKLAGQIGMFVPGGLKREAEAEAEARGEDEKKQGDEEGQREKKKPAEEGGGGAEARAGGKEPESIKKLRTLTLVRERLDSVIKIFGDAMEFTFPPSEVSVSSGFLSVSAPEPGSDRQSSEEKGQQVLRRLREEISALLGNREDAVSGIEKAAERIEQLKELTTVWTGTAEERGRTKFVESLARMVEDRHRELLREIDLKKSEATAARQERGGSGGATARDAAAAAAAASAAASAAAVVPDEAKALPGGFGLISQLQKLRGGL